jgi:hypothetical protein
MVFVGFWCSGRDLHPDGDRLVVPHNLDQATDALATASDFERLIVVTN